MTLLLSFMWLCRVAFSASGHYLQVGEPMGGSSVHLGSGSGEEGGGMVSFCNLDSSGKGCTYLFRLAPLINSEGPCFINIAVILSCFSEFLLCVSCSHVRFCHVIDLFFLNFIVIFVRIFTGCGGIAEHQTLSYCIAVCGV